MTKEKAVKILKSFKVTGDNQHEALDMAIKALDFDLDKHDEEVILNTIDTLWDKMKGEH